MHDLHFQDWISRQDASSSGRKSIADLCKSNRITDARAKTRAAKKLALLFQSLGDAQNARREMHRALLPAPERARRMMCQDPSGQVDVTFIHNWYMFASWRANNKIDVAAHASCSISRQRGARWIRRRRQRVSDKSSCSYVRAVAANCALARWQAKSLAARRVCQREDRSDSIN